MPTNNHVEKAFSLIENDSSKVFGLKIGDQTIQPGQYVARQGMYVSSSRQETWIISNLAEFSRSCSPTNVF